jgi:hypothetical protein
MLQKLHFGEWHIATLPESPTLHSRVIATHPSVTAERLPLSESSSSALIEKGWSMISAHHSRQVFCRVNALVRLVARFYDGSLRKEIHMPRHHFALGRGIPSG